MQDLIYPEELRPEIDKVVDEILSVDLMDAAL